MSESKKYFNIMKQHCDIISERIMHLSFEDWSHDGILRDAVCMRLFALAECVKKCTKERPALYEEFPNIPWDRIVRFRDRVSHHYEGIDFDVVWEILKSDFQPLHDVINSLADEKARK